MKFSNSVVFLRSPHLLFSGNERAKKYNDNKELQESAIAFLIWKACQSTLKLGTKWEKQEKITMALTLVLKLEQVCSKSNSGGINENI